MANVIFIPPFPTVVEVDMAAQVRCVSLAPGESDTFTFNWYHVIGADRVGFSEWTVSPEDSPVTIEGDEMPTDNVLTLVTLAVDAEFRGCAHATVTNKIITVQGRTLIRCISVDVEECGGCGC